MNQIPDADATTTADRGSRVRGRLSVPVAAAVLVSGWALAPVALSASDGPVGAGTGSDVPAERAMSDSGGDALGVIVSYRDGTTELQRDTAIRLANMVLRDDLERGLALGDNGGDSREMEALDLAETVSVSDAESVATVLEAMPFVEAAEPNRVVSLPPMPRTPVTVADAGADATQVLPGNGILWGLDRIDQRVASLDSRYEHGESGTGVRAYIFDTGINPLHPEFGTRVVSGYSSIADGRGTNDCHFHGTHVAGTVGGTIVGVAKDVTLVPVRVLDCGGSGSNAGIIAAINWVIGNHPAGTPGVANLSLGGGYSAAMNSAIEDLVESGITAVVAAGNSNLDSCWFSPASAPSAITVGASTVFDEAVLAETGQWWFTDTDARAPFSNHGTCNDIYAPGRNIVSAWYGPEGGYVSASGTSMAAPHVAGVVARMLSADPGLGPDQVWARLSTIATPFSSDVPGDAARMLYAPAALGAPTVTMDAPTEPVSGRSVEFGLEFSRAVTGLGTADLALSGTASGCAPTVSGSGALWTVSVSCDSDGTVRMTLAAAAVTDAAGITGPISPETSGIVALDAPPSATIAGPGAVNDSRTVDWTVTFDEAVTGLSASDFEVSGTATPCSLALSGSGADYAVRTECGNDGTVALTLRAGAATDATGNAGPVAAVTASATISVPTPTATLLVPGLASTIRTVFVELRLSDPVPVAPGHFSNAGTARNCTFAPAGSGTRWTVVVACGTDGTLIVRFDPPTVVAATALPVTISSAATSRVATARARFTPKALARLANIAIPARSRIRTAVSRKTSRNCRVVGSRIVRTANARCTVTLTITPPRGRPFKKKIVVNPAL